MEKRIHERIKNEDPELHVWQQTYIGNCLMCKKLQIENPDVDCCGHCFDLQKRADKFWDEEIEIYKSLEDT